VRWTRGAHRTYHGQCCTMVPQLDPLNKGISRTIGTLADDLDKQGPLAASEGIQTSVHAMALAFTAMSGAMAGKSRGKVTTAVNDSRVAYRDLKKVCAFD
jgi:hypothetical protein